MTIEQALPEETWRPVVGYEDLYSVSSLGHVRRDQPYHRRAGHIYLKATLRTLRGRAAYLQVVLSKGDIRKVHTVHRLVVEAFLGPSPTGKSQVNHRNGIKNDNRVENLEWVSAKENVVHAYATGLSAGRAGEQNPLAKLTESDVRAIRDSSEPQSVLARRYGVVQQTISRVKLNQSYR